MKFILISSAALAVFLLTGQASAADGQEVYSNYCAVCHSAMPPKLGDKAAWGPLLKQGQDVLIAAVVNGKGAMPPKGGNSSLSEEDIKAALNYMLDQVK
jgi:cytochrome c5